MSRVGEAALAVLDHEALAGRDVAIAYAHLSEHLAVRLPALRRDHMADIAALVIEELDVRILGEECLERIVGIEAIPSGGDGRRHELNAQGRGVGVVKMLFEFPGPWLTDKPQTLSFSGCFLVLKHKTRLATWSILLLRGHRWFRIRCATEVHRRDQLVALRESIVHPMPANLQITC